MVQTLLLALLPIALLIALGAGLRRHALVAESFWAQAERLGYYVLLPALFLHGLATARLTGVAVLAMVATLSVSTLVVAGILVTIRRHLTVDDAAFTSVFQGGVRFNNYVGVSAACHAFGLHGSAAVTVLLFQALPTASSSYIMARQLGGDAPLMAGIIASQTLLAGLVLPLSVLGLAGWI